MKYHKFYGIFKIEGGKLLGYVEHSFSMAWEPSYVRLWDKRSIQYYIDKNHILKDPNIFVLRATRKNLPYGIVINWAKRYKRINTGPVTIWGIRGTKFDNRNVPFYINTPKA